MHYFSKWGPSISLKGSIKNYTTEHSERNHKVAKDAYKSTNRKDIAKQIPRLNGEVDAFTEIMHEFAGKCQEFQSFFSTFDDNMYATVDVLSRDSVNAVSRHDIKEGSSVTYPRSMVRGRKKDSKFDLSLVVPLLEYYNVISESKIVQIESLTSGNAKDRVLDNLRRRHLIPDYFVRWNKLVVEYPLCVGFQEDNSVHDKDIIRATSLFNGVLFNPLSIH